MCRFFSGKLMAILNVMLYSAVSYGDFMSRQTNPSSDYVSSTWSDMKERCCNLIELPVGFNFPSDILNRLAECVEVHKCLERLASTELLESYV